MQWPTLVPVELKRGIIGDATPALAHSAVHGIAEMTSRHLKETLHRAHLLIRLRSTSSAWAGTSAAA